MTPFCAVDGPVGDGGCRWGLLGGCSTLTGRDLAGGEGAAPERPCQGATGCFVGERGRRDGQDQAPGVGLAVAAHPAVHDRGQGAPPAGAYHQVAGAAGGVDQDQAGLAAPDHGPDRQVGGRCSRPGSARPGAAGGRLGPRCGAAPRWGCAGRPGHHRVAARRERAARWRRSRGSGAGRSAAPGGCLVNRSRRR
jgi:hypothetical protein